MKDLTTPAIDAVNTLLGDGVPDDLTQRILELSIEAMHVHHERQLAEARSNRGAEQTECDIDENGWLNEGWAAWRLTLAEPRTISSGEPRPARGVTITWRACW